MSKKIVVLDGYTEIPGDLTWTGLAELGKLTVYDRTVNECDILPRIGDASIVLTNKTVLSRNIINKAPNIKYIGVLATGYNVVDIEAAKEKGIVVTNIPSYGTESVAQFAFALLLEICHHIGHHDKVVHDGKWTNSKDFCFWDFPLIELAGKTLGIVGYGRIGQAVGRIAQGFGMKVIATYHNSKTVEETNSFHYCTLDELYKKADIISLHCPLTKETEGIINSDSISRMKDGVIIINNSRGGLIVEEDLKVALNSGKVMGAAVDVVSSEPIKDDNPLLTAKNCIITPHISWAPKESRQRLMDIAIANVKAFLDGHPINTIV